MRKIFLGIIVVLLVLAIGAFVISAEATNVNSQTNSSVIGQLSSQVSGFVAQFASKRGIDQNSITGVGQVDFNSLPKEVNIKNVNDNNLAIYQINYSQNNQNKQVYVVAYSLEQLKAQGDLIVASDKRNFLDFGYSGIMNQSGFLNTGAGVQTSDSKGYVMPRDGSITAISTNLEVIQGNPGEINIVILKNGQPISFGNTIDATAIGMKKDYDVQEKGIVNFQAGDVISVVATNTGNVAWRDVITMVEITTNS
ncbi:MAG: hypothetical protein ABSG05_02735 [Candidatus Pacearchaeota archaeon]|jgi:hypothetical protein